jgi:hypothetical protein
VDHARTFPFSCCQIVGCQLNITILSQYTTYRQKYPKKHKGSFGSYYMRLKLKNLFMITTITFGYHAIGYVIYLELGNMPMRCTGRENSYHDSAQPGEKTHITTRCNAYSITFCLIQLSFLVLVFQSTFIRNLF